MTPREPFPRTDRRTALKWIAAAAASPALLDGTGLAAEEAGQIVAKGYGRDPVMAMVYSPGDLWPLSFSDHQREKVIILCDIIMPADDTSPSASSLGVHDFIDEWISSPYPDQDGDRKLILRGLAWLDEESARRGVKSFTDLDADTQLAICTELAKEAQEDSKKFPGSFFRRMRDLVSGGYYTTPEGMKDIGYVGNVAMPEWNGPTPEALAHLGIDPE